MIIIIFHSIIPLLIVYYRGERYKVQGEGVYKVQGGGIYKVHGPENFSEKGYNGKL